MKALAASEPFQSGFRFHFVDHFFLPYHIYHMFFLLCHHDTMTSEDRCEEWKCMYRLDLPREDMDLVVVNSVDSNASVTLHTFGHVRNSTEDDWIDVASWFHTFFLIFFLHDFTLVMFF